MAKGFRAPKGAASKGGASRGGMMEQIQKLQEQLAEAQEQLANETVSATAGGGAVEVTVTGDQRCTAIVIDPGLLEDGDVEMLQDLVLTAVNSALEKSREMAADRLGPMASGLPF